MSHTTGLAVTSDSGLTELAGQDVTHLLQILWDPGQFHPMRSGNGGRCGLVSPTSLLVKGMRVISGVGAV